MNEYNKLIIEVDKIQSGQPRPYADSIYESTITCKKGDGTPWDLSDDLIKSYAKVLIRNFNESDKRGWWEGRLDVFKKVSDGIWHIKIIEPYTD